MPELPDVEHFRAVFARTAEGKTVRSVWSDPSILRNADPVGVDIAMRGRTFQAPTRHGKWLLAWTDGPCLLVHFGMTGDLIWSGEAPDRHRHDRLVLMFRQGGELRYRNMRKLGGVWLAHDPEDVAAVLGELGPDALSISKRAFLQRLSRRRGAVKAVLMNQRVIAGVGNLLADEILWQARLHPERRVETLSEEELGRLFTQFRRIVRESVRAYDYLDRKVQWLSHVRGLPGATCPRCGTTLQRTVVGGRTTWFCPRCQT
jgi:formamidopyrimidine-DNA glycosylase